ncbi:MAG: hypothetical protein V3T23_05000, partial [Nitrososphaerales archaeon]
MTKVDSDDKSGHLGQILTVGFLAFGPKQQHELVFTPPGVALPPSSYGLGHGHRPVRRSKPMSPSGVLPQRGKIVRMKPLAPSVKRGSAEPKGPAGQLDVLVLSRG